MCTCLRTSLRNVLITCMSLALVLVEFGSKLPVHLGVKMFLIVLLPEYRIVDTALGIVE